MKTLKHFINGQYVAGRSEDTFELVSPVDGETYALSPNADAEEVEQAYSAAEAAFSIWRKSTPAQRQKALLQLADEIERNVERLVNAQSQETGQLRHFIEKEEIAAKQQGNIPPGLPRLSAVNRWVSLDKSRHGTTRS